MYASVPTTSPGIVSGVSLTTWATPKSASLAKPAPAAGSATTMTFCGLTSRWITPRSCACASASQSAAPIRATSRSAIALARTSSARVRPRTSSETRYTSCSSYASSYMATMPGWLSRAAARASRSTRSPLPSSRGIALTATSRSSFSSQASQTTPNPPAPRRRSRRYRPSTSRGPGAPGSACVGAAPPSGRVPGSSARLFSGRFTSGSVFGPRWARPAPRSYSHEPWQALESARRGTLLLSFLDEPDEPARGRRRPPRGPSTDRQTLMVRRSIALVAGVIVLILLVLGVRSCLNTRSENAIKNYSNDSAELLRASKLEGDQLFKLLQGEGGTNQATAIINQLNAYRVDSSELVDRANRLDVPGDLKGARSELQEVLELRRDGFADITDALQVALGDQERRQGSDDVAKQMQVFLASDIVDTQRFRPALFDVLRDKDLSAPDLPQNGFVPDIQWLQPDFVADQVNALRTGTGGGGEAAPGLHGNGVAGVTLGGIALTPGGNASVQLAGDLSFEI